MSLVSSLGNLIKPITQRLTGKAQPDAKPKAEVAVILAAGTAGSYFLWKGLKPADFMPSSNYATYAGLFIMALAIERILEPFSGLFVPATKKKKAESRATAAQAKRAQTAATSGPRAAVVVPVGQAKKAAVAEQAAAVQRSAAARKAAAAAQREAAVAQTTHHRYQSARAVLMWATASVLAMLVCAALGIFLLRSVETPSPAKAAPPRRLQPREGSESCPGPAGDRVGRGCRDQAAARLDHPGTDLIGQLQGQGLLHHAGQLTIRMVRAAAGPTGAVAR